MANTQCLHCTRHSSKQFTHINLFNLLEEPIGQLGTERLKSMAKITTPTMVRLCPPFLKILFIYFQREGKKREGEGEKHRCARETWISCLRAAPNPGPGLNPGMCSDQELNLQPLHLQDNAQPTGLSQSGPDCALLTPTALRKEDKEALQGEDPSSKKRH